jgi:hypothetical protein
VIALISAQLITEAVTLAVPNALYRGERGATIGAVVLGFCLLAYFDHLARRRPAFVAGLVAVWGLVEAIDLARSGHLRYQVFSASAALVVLIGAVTLFVLRGPESNSR